MTRVLVVLGSALALAAPAGATAPVDKATLLDGVAVTFAPGASGSAWRIARIMRDGLSPDVRLDSMTMYPNLVELAFANLDLRITPIGPAAFRPSWLVRLSNFRACSAYTGGCWTSTAWFVLGDDGQSYEFGWP